MSTLKIKDADAADRYLGVMGTGTSPLPFYSIPADFYLEVAKGNVAGHSLKIIRGHNSDIDIGTEDLWETGGAITHLSSAETMNIVSTSTDDDGGGIGLLTLLLEGVDGTGAYASETIVMDGTSNVLSSNSYLRVNMMTSLTAGTTGWNVGNITATASSAATVQDEMDATEGISQSSHYTIPLAVTGYLVRIELNCAKISGGGASPEVEFKGYITPNGGARIQAFDKRLDTDVTDELILLLPFPTLIPARTDIKFTATTDTNDTDARSRMYIVEVDD